MKKMFVVAKNMIIPFLMCLILFISIIPVNATTYTANSKGKSFSDEWSVTKINTSERTFKYGYNTDFINEDYTHTYHRSKSHSAYVKNSGSAHEEDASKGTYAKAEIKHHSGVVYYEYNY